MKKLLFLITLFFSTNAISESTLSWTMGDVVEAAPVSEVLIFVSPEAGNYADPPIRLATPALEHIFDCLSDGKYKIKMKAFSGFAGTESVEASNEVIFEVKACDVFKHKPNAPGAPSIKTKRLGAWFDKMVDKWRGRGS